MTNRQFRSDRQRDVRSRYKVVQIIVNLGKAESRSDFSFMFSATAAINITEVRYSQKLAKGGTWMGMHLQTPEKALCLSYYFYSAPPQGEGVLF